jgi:hypothetical protein
VNLTFRLLGASTAVAVILVSNPNVALAQVSRLGGNIEVIPPSASSRFPAVAYDAGSDSYLVVTGVAKVSARFVSASGVPLGEADSVNNAGPGAAGVACAINACLVAWIQEPTTIMARLLRSNGGSLQYLTDPFPVSTNGLYKLTSSAPGVAASASGEFLVAWTELGPNTLKAQRVTGSGSVTGAEILISGNAVSMLPSLTYNSTLDEYAVAYQYEPSSINQVALQRVKPGSGALIGGPSILYSGSFAQYPEIAYNSRDNQYFAITWGGSMITGGRADGTGQSLTGGAPQPIAVGGIGDGIGLAYNPVTNSYLAVYLSVHSPEIWAVEVSNAGVPGNQFQLTAWGAIDNVAFSTQPSVAGSSASSCFLEVNSAGYSRIVGQLASSGSGCGRRRASPADFDGDSRADITIYRPGTGKWHKLSSKKNFVHTSDPDSASETVFGGVVGDVPVPADYDGDGIVDLAFRRLSGVSSPPNICTWFIRYSSTGLPSDTNWGFCSDIPVPADFDGDGKADLGVYRPTTGRWFVLSGADGTTLINNWKWGAGPEDGLAAPDTPVVGDYDGDKKADLAVYRPTTGRWFVLLSSSGLTQWWSVKWGLDTSAIPGDYIGDGNPDKPVAADYDGDGRLDFAVFRPSTGYWYVLHSSNSYATWSFAQWGNATDELVPADYDGDGRADIAVFRPSTGRWYIHRPGKDNWYVDWGIIPGDIAVNKK